MEQISAFDIFKIGIGPSSSHTMGPWKAVQFFLSVIENEHGLENVDEVVVSLYGSLALTGIGHGTDLAICLGLAGYSPETIELDKVEKFTEEVKTKGKLLLHGKHEIPFLWNKHIRFHRDCSLEYHPNGIQLQAFGNDGLLTQRVYFSIGGGFVVEEGVTKPSPKIKIPYPINSAKDLKEYCHNLMKPISWIVNQNEKCLKAAHEVDSQLVSIWSVMLGTIYRGCHNNGTLPGGLQVTRRAPDLCKKLSESDTSRLTPLGWMEKLRRSTFSFETTLKWVNCFAIATNEENAGFGRVVTAPTNGAAGVIPAVLMYYICFSDKKEVDERQIANFLLTAAEIGSLFKKGSTISAAMGGCQAEIGVSFSYGPRQP